MAAFLALSAVLAIATVAILLRPLWRGTRGVGVVVALVMLASTALLYRVVGTPRALDPGNVTVPATLGDAIAQLEAQLRRNPDQPEGWRLLGQAYQREEQAAKARDAFARAAALAPDSADILTEAAQARALADDERRFDPPAVRMLQSALAVDPRHQRARWFLGIAQRQMGDGAAAAATWEMLLPMVDAATAASLRREIDAARAEAGLAPLPAGPEAAAGASSGITVRVSLDPSLAARMRLRGDASVFVIARAPGGAPMPVAVQKRSVAGLPFTAILDDDDSPMPTRKLSQLREVELVARLSDSGLANRQDGDIESSPVRVPLPSQEPVELVIGRSE